MLRKLAIACAAAAAYLAFGATPAAASADDFVGQWTNQDSAADGITRIVVTRRRAGLRIDVFGRCHPSDCEWGEVEARTYAPSGSGDAYRDATVVIAQYDAAYARRTVIVRLTREGARYEAYTDFTDRSGRASYVEEGRLRRTALPTPPWPRPGGPGGPGRPGFPGGGASELSEDCVGFTADNLQVVNVRGSWKIVESGHWIADFGANRAAADRSLDIIRRYGFTSQCFVARPGPAMTYWRHGDTIPGGALAGEDCIVVNPAAVRAQYTGGAWKVVDGRNWLLDFGAARDDAEQAVAVIQHYNLTRQCFVGRPNAPMQYWLSR